MFSQACVTSTPGGGGRWTTPKVNNLPPGQDHPQARVRVQPPPPLARVRGQPPRPFWPESEVNHLPPFGQGQRSTPPPPPDRTTTPPGQGQRSTTSSRTGPPSPPQEGKVIDLSPPPPPGHYVQTGGTHHTGMHSCLSINVSCLTKYVVLDLWSLLRDEK